MKTTIATSTNGNQKAEEARVLRDQRAGLEQKLAAARVDLAAARERQEFMEEEVEQVRSLFIGDKTTCYKDNGYQGATQFL